MPRRVIPMVSMMVALILVVVVFAPCAGCSVATERGFDFGPPSFSPDDSTVAFVWCDLEVPVLGPEPVRLAQTAYVRWCPVDDPGRMQSIKVESVGKEWEGYPLSSLVHPFFSPDSKRLAVVSLARLLLVDLADGRVRQLSRKGEIVTGFAWLSADEVGYSAHTNVRKKLGENRSDRTFWRQKIHKPLDERVWLFREKASTDTSILYWEADWPLEHWSPTGRHVIFGGDSAETAHLLDVETGKVNSFPMHFRRFVSWRPDGSAAVCVSGYTPPTNVWLIDPATGAATDIKVNWAETFGSSMVHVEPLWTADGNYLIMRNTDGAGGVLVQPQPWRVVELGKKLGTQVKTGDGVTRMMGASLSHVPVPGWVRANGIAVNYEGKEMADLDHGRRWLSHDGRFTAEVGVIGQVIVRPVK